MAPKHNTLYQIFIYPATSTQLWLGSQCCRDLCTEFQSQADDHHNSLLTQIVTPPSPNIQVKPLVLGCSWVTSLLPSTMALNSLPKILWCPVLPLPSPPVLLLTVGAEAIHSLCTVSLPALLVILYLLVTITVWWVIRPCSSCLHFQCCSWWTHHPSLLLPNALLWFL